MYFTQWLLQIMAGYVVKGRELLVRLLGADQIGSLERRLGMEVVAEHHDQRDHDVEEEIELEAEPADAQDARAHQREGHVAGAGRRARVAEPAGQQPAGADLGHQAEVFSRVRALAEAGRGVVMVVHDLVAAARHADRLVAMKDGRVVAAGRPSAIVTPALVRELYGVDVHVLQRPGDGAPVVVPAD